jgi:iron(II)-dependent oxidoreductase
LIVKDPLQSSQLNCASRTISQGQYQIGATSEFEPYDNEYPSHEVALDDTQIAVNLVTNSEYLCFMEAGIYKIKSYWSASGWQWCQQNTDSHPEYWRADNNDNWYGINHAGAFELHAADPVYGINHFEAEAFACWAGARLPHEYEWEIADQQGLLQNTGKVWEWCANTFHPYDGFRAFPYEGYSTPYFDGKHYVLKGASIHTQDIIRRSSFRNYYQADKHHLFAGMRLVFEK